MDISFYIGKVVEILPAILELEVDYLEPGMLARIEKIEFMEDNFTAATLDVSEFEDRNRSLETSNYYDKTGQPTLSARESGNFEVKTKCYLAGLNTYEDFFRVVPESGFQELLAKEYAKRSDMSLTYIGWCEKELERLWYR